MPPYAEPTDVIQLNPMTAGASGVWLDYRHLDYQRNINDWLFTRDMYTGDCVRGTRVKNYLIRKHTGESDSAYEERCRLADYTNHFATLVDTISGMLFAVEGSANRIFNRVTPGAGGRRDVTEDVLGSFDRPDTPMGRLFINADGAGNGYQTVWKTLASDLMTLHCGWMLVDAADGNAMLRFFPATSVPNWRYDSEGLAEVLVEELVDARGSIQDEPKQESQYLYFERNGWSRWRKNEGGVPVMIEGQSGTYQFTDRANRRCLPIYPVSLGIRRNVGWTLARKGAVIFNKESERDNLLRLANFPRLNLIATDTEFEKLVTSLERGSNVLQVNPHQNGSKAHHYIHPSSEPAKVASDVLNRKVEEMYTTAFRQYGDAAKEITATEARQDISQGVGAFLQILKSSIDDAENEALWRLEQIYFPGKPKLWFTARVERSDDFVPLDVDMAIKAMRERYFGLTATVPVGRTAMISAAREIARWDGLVVSDDELAAGIDTRLLAESLTSFKDAGMQNIPTAIAVQAIVQLMRSLGAEVTDEQLVLKATEVIAQMEADAAQAKANADLEYKATIAKITQPAGGKATS